MRGWFHCGRCGKLFEAAVGSESNTCTHCGKDPSIFNESLIKLNQTVLPPSRKAGAKDVVAGRKRSIRKRGHGRLVAKITVAWLLLMAAIIGTIKLVTSEEEELGTRPAIAQPGTGNSINVDELLRERAIIEAALPSLSQNFGHYLQATTPEEKTQFVWDPIGTAGRLARFYTMNPANPVQVGEMEIISTRLLQLPERQAIGTVWKLNDGRTFDAVFFEKDGEWLLDWDQFIRYGDYPWSLFLAGNGADTSEFRLLARLRAAQDEANQKQLNVAFYAPRFGRPHEISGNPPEFLVPRDSEEGRILAAAFKAVGEGYKPFDGALSSADPDQMIRVRVKIKRTTDDGKKQYTLEKVIACHWVSSDDMGLPPSELEKAGEKSPQASETKE
jgi:hypothetical protein